MLLCYEVQEYGLADADLPAVPLPGVRVPLYHHASPGTIAARSIADAVSRAIRDSDYSAPALFTPDGVGTAACVRPPDSRPSCPHVSQRHSVSIGVGRTGIQVPVRAATKMERIG
jgi:hypothetical protein